MIDFVNRNTPKIADSFEFELYESKDGLDFYRRIIEEAPQHLKKKGLLILETGHDQGDDIRKLVEEQANRNRPYKRGGWQ